MTPKIKPILTVFLLAFVGVTLAVQVAREFRTIEPIRLSEGLNVVCTRATIRCPTCTTTRRLTKETLDESFRDGQVVFHEINYEHPASAAFAGEFKVATATIVLVKIKNGEVVAQKNLANEVWRLYTNHPAFKRMLKEQIEAMLQGETLDDDEVTQEITFDKDDVDIELPL